MTEIGGVLIIDDNEMNRDICQIHLEELSIPLHLAQDGEQGLTLAKQHQPDLILLDIMMPVIDGFEVLRQLKQLPKLKDVPILMLTAKTETNAVVTALELGANDYLRKPFEGEELIARAKTLLKSRALELQIAADLEAGAKMQEKFLTDASGTVKIFENSGYNIHVFNKPHSTVSGDFYYSFTNSKDEPSLLIGDSTGHGLSAALISMRIIGLLQQISTTIEAPEQPLEKLNSDISGLLPSGNFVAGSSFVFEDDKVIYSNAAQPYPILIAQDGITEIQLDAMPLGINPDSTYQNKTITLNAGDKLILYTDGLIEATNQMDEVYGQKRLLESISKHRHEQDTEIILDALVQDVKEFIGDYEYDDDVTLIVIKKE